MRETKNPKIRVSVKMSFPGGPIHYEYASLHQLGIERKLTENDLYELSKGRGVVFERDDVTLEGRLYLKDKRGEYLDDSHRRHDSDRYIVKVINSYDIPTQWEIVKNGFAVWNKIYDHWDIYLRTGDKLTFTDGEERLKRYEVELKE